MALMQNIHLYGHINRYRRHSEERSVHLRAEGGGNAERRGAPGTHRQQRSVC